MKDFYTLLLELLLRVLDRLGFKKAANFIFFAHLITGLLIIGVAAGLMIFVALLFFLLFALIGQTVQFFFL